MTPLRLLFVKDSQNWPRASGHDVHGYHLMKALADRGHAISLATVTPPSPAALAGLPLTGQYTLAERPGRLPLSGWQRRVARYYGAPETLGVALGDLLRDRPFDAVILVARHLVPLLAAVHGPVRVWYVADDPAWHHLSRLQVRQVHTWREVQPAMVNVLYERVFRPCYDRVWVVSRADRLAVRLFSGCRAVDVIANGVDTDHYQPAGEPDLPTSCVFWGRLDFEPNIDALTWFIGRVWPEVLRRTPTARLSVFGFNPGQRVRELTQAPGVELHPDLPDLRAEVTRRAVVVLPFISGGGIKNKLLEAAALGMPIVCTRWAVSGTRGRPPVRLCRTPNDWATVLAELWADVETRCRLGRAARQWVTRYHTWAAAAAVAEAAIRQSLRRRTQWSAAR